MRCFVCSGIARAAAESLSAAEIVPAVRCRCSASVFSVTRCSFTSDVCFGMSFSSARVRLLLEDGRWPFLTVLLLWGVTDNWPLGAVNAGGQGSTPVGVLLRLYPTAGVIDNRPAFSLFHCRNYSRNRQQGTDKTIFCAKNNIIVLTYGLPFTNYRTAAKHPSKA